MPINTSEAAAVIGCDDRTVRRAAREHGIGTETVAGYRFTGDDIKRLRKLIRPTPGRPRKEPPTRTPRGT